MKINRNLFLEPNYFIDEDLDFSKESFEGEHIRKIEDCHIYIKGHNYDSLFVMDIHIKAKVTTSSAYSSKDVVLNLDFNDTISISDEIEDDDDIFYEKSVIFDIDPYILSLIIANVPMVVIEKNEALPEDGKGYRVLSEEEYEKEQQNKVDPRWAALDDVELD